MHVMAYLAMRHEPKPEVIWRPTTIAEFLVGKPLRDEDRVAMGVPTCMERWGVDDENWWVK